MVRRVRGWVHQHHDNAIMELARWVAQPSVSRTGEGMAEAARFGADLIRRCGLDAAIVTTPGWPVLLGWAPAAVEPAPHVLVYGHYDVQPAGPHDAWVTPPFRPDIRGDRMYGRGTADNKGQHLAQLLGLRALRDVAGGLPCRVTVLLDGEEEIGSPHLADLVRDRIAADPPDLVVWSDGPVHGSGRACLVLGVRGILTFELRARGPAAPLHSGNWGGVAPNPAWELVQLLATMRDATGTVLVKGFADGVAPRSAADRAALSALPFDPSSVQSGVGSARMEPSPAAGYYERLGAPTFTINSLTCEDGGEHRTVIPSVAIARCDVRLVDDQRVPDVVEALRRHVAEHAPDVEFVPLASMPPSRTPPDSPYTATMLAAIAAGLGEPPLVIPALGGSLPIAAFTDVLDRPCYGVPLANVDEANHAPNENLQLDWFRRGIVAAAIIQHALGGARL
jgi:acetylornithine deacetylase/succinyl-diaminopimelate desuccinylase-like protein